MIRTLLAALVLTLPALMAPPQVCGGLTGDALAVCLYDDLDTRLRAMEGPPTASPTPSSSPIPTASPTATIRPPSGDWLSGTSNLQYVVDGSFGTWRSSPVEIAGVWVNDPAVYPFGPNIPGCGDCGRLRDWTGAVDVGMSPPNWISWQHETSGARDMFWRSTARNLAAARVGDGPTYVRPYYEFNGDWMPWSVRKGEEAQFRQAWQRVEGIFAAEFPAAVMMLGTAAAGGGNRIDVADAYPVGVDVVSIDFYNEWGWCNSNACFNDKIENGGGANSLDDLRRLAEAKGDPVLISEWGSAATPRPVNQGGGGDAPVFMEAFHNWLSEHAGTGPGKVLGEVYFNVGGYEARFELYPVTTQPQAAARYRALFATN